MLTGECGIRDHDPGSAAPDPEPAPPQRDKGARARAAVNGQYQCGSFRAAGHGP